MFRSMKPSVFLIIVFTIYLILPLLQTSVTCDPLVDRQTGSSKDSSFSLDSDPISVDGQGYDWSYSMLHALDPQGDHRAYHGDYYDSRDIVAWYYAVGADYVYFRIDFLDLAYGAETASNPDNGFIDALNIYLMIGWDGAPSYQEWVPDYVKDYDGDGVHLADYCWVLALAIYDGGNYRVYRTDWSYWDQSNLTLLIAYSSQWDFIEIGVPKWVLEMHGWSDTKTVWAKIATVWVDTNGNNWLFDAAPNSIADDTPGQDNQWSGALFSDQYTGTCKLVLLHHGNQHLTDNRALNPPDTANSYGFILWVHEDVSRLAGRPIPVMFHMSGTLLASYVWWDYGFVDYMRRLVKEGIAVPVGGMWAEYITAYFYDNFNALSAKLAQDYYYHIFGYRPITAWIPERTWDDERTGIVWTLSKYYKAVVLDGNTHHDDWSPDTNSLKPHKYDTSKTGGRPLYVFFIHWETQQTLLNTWDGGLNKDLRILYLNYAMNPDQQQVFVYADDWEKAAGIAGWPTDPHNYENTVRWIAQHPWIQVTTIDEIVSWIESGSWTPVEGYYCGYDTYSYLKSWVNDYPYDDRRAYDGWYWGTSSEEAFNKLGSNEPGYQLTDNIGPLGDIWWEGTTIYKLLAPGQGLDNCPRNEFWKLAVYTLDAMLYETAWHEENDWDGDGLQDCPGWGRAQWAHLRLVNVLFIAAKWLDDVRKGLVTTPNVSIGDYDWDGLEEAIMYNDRLFIFIDRRGGAIPYVFVYDNDTDYAWMAVGAPMVYWGTEEYEKWWGASQVGLFVDDYFDLTGENYYWREYVINEIFHNESIAYVVLRSPDVNNDGRYDIVKKYVIEMGSSVLFVDYYIQVGGSLYIASALSMDPLSTLIKGQGILEPINQPVGTYEFGYINHDTSVKAAIKPLKAMAFTGTSDWATYTLQYVFKLKTYSYGAGDYYLASAKASFSTIEQVRRIDASPSDWNTSLLPSNENSYCYGSGEFVWRDKVGDEITYFYNPDPNVDLVELRITSDDNYLYMLLVFNNLTISTGDGAPLIEIAIDYISGTGETSLASFIDYSVKSDHAWERLVVSTLGSRHDIDGDGRYELLVYDSNWYQVGGLGDDAAVSTTTNSIELRVSWRTLGIDNPDNITLNIAVVIARSTPEDFAWDIPGEPDVLDTVSYTSTVDEVSDGVQDYVLPVQFSGILPQPVPEETMYTWITVAIALALSLLLYRLRNRQ